MTTPEQPINVDMNYSGRDRENFYVFLTRPGKERRGDFERVRGMALEEGTVLHLWDCDGDGHGNHDDLIIEGTVHYDATQDQWGAITPWANIRHVSDVREQPEHWANKVDWEGLHRRTGRGGDPA